VDGDGKVILLLLDIIDGYTGSGGYVGGYFHGYHMFEANAGFPYSNEADMLFLDVNPATAGSESFYSTIAHELQHLINFSHTYMKDGREQEIWINEGLSAAAEYIYGDGAQPAQQTLRIDYFNADPRYHPGNTIYMGNNFFVWDGYWERETGDVLANYATAYLFFQWLRIHASDDVGIYKKIVDSTHRDYRAVTGAAASSIDGQFSVWDTLLSTWMIANAFNDDSGHYGYKEEIATTIYYVDTGKASWPFSPGEGIFSRLDNNGPVDYRAGSGSHIRYAGLVDPSVNRTPPFTGDLLLTYNANTDSSGPDELGFCAVTLDGSGGPMSLKSGRNMAPAEPLPESYPVGFGDITIIRGRPGKTSGRPDKFKK
jgi:hypothetical protein